MLRATKCSVFNPHDNIVDSHSCGEYRIFMRTERLSQTRVHLVDARTNLFTNQRMSSVPIRVKYKHFKTIWERTSDNSPTRFQLLLLEKLWSSKRCIEKLCTIAPSFYSPVHNTSLREFSRLQVFLSCGRRNSLFELSPTLLRNSLVQLAFTLSASQIHRIEKC